MQQPRKYDGNPILRPSDEAGERQLQGQVLWDPLQGKFLIWYLRESRGGVATLRYAVSTDGLDWEYPSLGLYEENGSRDNNVLADEHGRPICPKSAIFINPRQDDPAARFVGIFQRWHYYYGYSADGIRWAVDMEHPVWERGSGDGLGECMSFMYDPAREVWRAYVRVWIDNCTLRVTGHGESADMRSWSGPKIIFAADDQWGIGAQVYTLNAWSEEGAYWALAGIYYTDLHPEPRRQQTMQPSLLHSFDGLNWTPVDTERPFIPLGEPGQWDGEMIGAGAPVIKDSRTLYYYVGFVRKHNCARTPDADRQRSGTGLAVGRQGGYVAFRSRSGQAATVTTEPFRLRGDQLAINAVTRENGWIKAELIDPGGGIIPALGIERDCDPFAGDAVDGLMSWRGNGMAMQRAVGENVRLRLRWENAEVFGFRIARSDPDIARLSDGPRPIRCNRTATPPVIDGVLGDEVWQDFTAIGVADQFTWFDRTEPAPVKSTLYVTRDDEALYFGLSLEEPHTDELVANCTHIDGERTLLTDDSLQIELQPGGEDGLVTMVLFNSKGARGLITIDPVTADGFRPADPPALEVAASVSQGRWEAEVRLPFSLLNVSPPVAGDSWRFNVHRFRQAGQAERAVYSWACTFGQVLRHDRRGQLRFG